MADVTSRKEEDWGPEQTDLPPVGSIFLMRLFKTDQPPTVDDPFRYKLIGTKGRDLILEQWDNGKWWSGHSWSMDYNPGFRILKTSISQAATPQSKGGCVCMRCNSGNPWAKPNRPDGKYLCYECR